MSHRIALITDSTCDLPMELRRQYDIPFVPLYIVWKDEILRERVDIEPQEFYRRLRSDPFIPTTSQPTPQDFLDAYDKAQRRGAKEIVVITISSAMSGTIRSAQQAGDMCELPVHVYDGRTNSMGLGWQALAAARVRERGGDVQAMLAAADEVRQRLVYLISLDTLRYLHKGGRIGGATRFIGTLLNIKPQIYVDHESGRVEAGRSTRSRKRAIATLYRDFFDQVDTSLPLRVAVLHNDAPDEAQRLAAQVEAEYHPVELLTEIVSPVLGVHTGPGALSLCGYADPTA